MKTYLIFLCLIIGSGLANATIQNKADADKPPVIFVNQYSDKWVYDDGNGITWGASKNYIATTNGSEQANGYFFYHAFFPGSGEGWWDTVYNWSDTNLPGFYSTIGGFGDVIVDGSGQLIHCDYITVDPYSAPTIVWDDTYNVGLSQYYANVNYSWMYDTTNLKYTQNTKTSMLMKTGGKVGVNRQNLFAMNANATEFGRSEGYDLSDGPEYWNGTPMTTIDPTRIRVLGKNVGNDGNLFTVLPDNATLDLNASAPGRHYGLNVTAQKYKLHILVNSEVPLQPHHVVWSAKFSVGQKLTFSLLWSPSAPPFVETGNTYQWLLSGSLVNGWNSLGAGYDDYFFDTSLLNAAQPAVWYYSDAPSKKATIDLNLHFSNGQQVKLAKDGLYTVLKPAVTHLGSSASHYGGLNVQSGFLWLSMGTSTDENDDGNMEFSADVNSQSPGAICWTQLVNCTNESGFPTAVTATGGHWDLDDSLIYDKSYKDLTQYHSAHTNFYENTSGFSDCPRIIVGNDFSTMNSSFMTFLRFKPSTPDAIWVTLARADWAWHAEATGDPILVVNDVTGPTFTFTNQFPPMWYDVEDIVSIVKDDGWYLFFGL